MAAPVSGGCLVDQPFFYTARGGEGVGGGNGKRDNERKAYKVDQAFFYSARGWGEGGNGKRDNERKAYKVDQAFLSAAHKVVRVVWPLVALGQQTACSAVCAVLSLSLLPLKGTW